MQYHYKITAESNRIAEKIDDAIKAQVAANKEYRAADSIPSLHNRIAAHAEAADKIKEAYRQEMFWWNKLAEYSHTEEGRP